MPLLRISAGELVTEDPRIVRVDDPIRAAVDVLQTRDLRQPANQDGFRGRRSR